MTIVALVSMLVMVGGALVYLVSSNPSLKQLGLVAFGCGLLVSLFTFSGHTVRIG
jgi:hypothetical protein